MCEQLETENALLKKEVEAQRQQIAELSSHLASITKQVCVLSFVPGLMKNSFLFSN